MNETEDRKCVTIEEIQLPDGKVPNPHNWDINFLMDVEKEFKIIENIAKQHGGESTEHYKLKTIGIMFVRQLFGDNVDFKIEQTTIDDKYRPDIVANLLNDRKMVAIECGDLTFKNKIELLLTNGDFDCVIWVIYPNCSQLRYLADVPFFKRCKDADFINDIHFPFRYGNADIIIAKQDDKKYYATYRTFLKSWPKNHIDILLFYRKDFVEKEDFGVTP